MTGKLLSSPSLAATQSGAPSQQRRCGTMEGQ